jgi:dTMP kinase
VLCDRFADSTFAYQGFAGVFTHGWNANRAATGGLMPHRTLLLDVPASIGLTRRRGATRTGWTVNPQRSTNESTQGFRHSRREPRGASRWSMPIGRSSRSAEIEDLGWLVLEAPDPRTIICRFTRSLVTVRLPPRSRLRQPGNVWHTPISSRRRCHRQANDRLLLRTGASLRVWSNRGRS